MSSLARSVKAALASGRGPASTRSASARATERVVTFEHDIDVELLVVACSPELRSSPRKTESGRISTAFVWDARGAETLDAELCVGLGAARTIDAARGSLAADTSTLFQGLDGEVSCLRAFGAVSFDEQDLGPFAPFGHARFTIPRWTFFASSSGLARVVLVAGPDEDAIIAEARAIDARLEKYAALGDDAPPPRARVVDDGADVFVDVVQQATRAIEAGALEKVVTARKVVLHGAMFPGLVLGRLRGVAGCVRFGLLRGDAAFVGATPEVLVRVDARGIRTEAVAGSEPRRGADLAEVARLLLRDKDRREHALVVDAIRAGLASSGADVTAEEEPHVRTLTHVHHLVTAIAATSPGANALSLVKTLHPTPAMGGCPREAAAAFLRAHEGFPRGLYASPIGWIDARGHGAFVVGIRSALMTQAEATLYGGCGIVRGSVPKVELAETSAKLRMMLDALGATMPATGRMRPGSFEKEADL
ncbi:MAG: isochorismate synthase [Polyangiaceae bacterium]|nr:isochorismate synthase [Polyangiaceae bacterium]